MSDFPRHQCDGCGAKHIFNACELVIEAHSPQTGDCHKVAYAYHIGLAIGHLGQAVEETQYEYPRLAAECRRYSIILLEAIMQNDVEATRHICMEDLVIFTFQCLNATAFLEYDPHSTKIPETIRNGQE